MADHKPKDKPAAPKPEYHGHLSTDKKYREMPDKPDPTTVAQIEVTETR